MVGMKGRKDVVTVLPDIDWKITGVLQWPMAVLDDDRLVEN
jgi:hypothetical protein